MTAVGANKGYTNISREGIVDRLRNAETTILELHREIERLRDLCEDLKADRRCVVRDMQAEIDAAKAAHRRALTTTEGR